MPIIAAQLEAVLEKDPESDAAGNVTFELLGMKVFVSKSAGERRRIRTPTDQKALPTLALADKTPLPGRKEQGFVGCTAIVVGNYDTQTNILEVAYPPTTPAGLPPGAPFEHHPFLEIGPPETLLLGPCTSNSNGEITVNGFPVEILAPTADPKGRLVPPKPKNEFGIDINVKNIQVNDPVSVEGYLSSDDGPKRFIGLVVEVDSTNPNLLENPNTPQIGITRAQGRNRGGLFDLEVRGGIYAGPPTAGQPRTQRVIIHRLDVDDAVEGDPNGVLGTLAEAPAGGFDKWVASRRLTGTTELPFAPVGVRATWFNSAAAPATEKVETRDDPDNPPTDTTPP